MRRIVFALTALALAGPLAFAQDAAKADATVKPLVVFAAASLKNALDAALDAYAKTGATRPVVSYAASNALAKQLEAGAPADLFLSADEEWMNYAAGKKLVTDTSRVNLLTNTLVLIAPAAAAPKLDLADPAALNAALGEGRLAVGQTASVPAGKYAKAALTSLGIWDSVKDKLAEAENVRAALALVARGEAPLGVVYATDAKSDPKIAIVATFPASSHAPIIYPMAVTVTAASEAAALAKYLAGADAAAIFERFGFGVVRPS